MADYSVITKNWPTALDMSSLGVPPPSVIVTLPHQYYFVISYLTLNNNLLYLR